MAKRYYISAALLLAGCTAITPLSQHGTLVLKPQFSEGQFGTKTLIPPYSQADINQLVLKIFTFDGTEHDQNIQRTLLNAQLDNPIVFSNLKPNTTYRIKAYAYTAGSLLISDEASSSTDIVLTNDDRPSVATLSVKLVNRAFNGQATSSITIYPGGYSPVGSESLKYSGLEGIVTTLAGNGAAAFADGTGTSASFNMPACLCFDSHGNLIVADFMNSRIRKVTPAGVVTTIAGSGAEGWQDGTGTAAVFSRPVGVVMDAQDNIFVADHVNYRIRKISSTGVVTTIAGNGTIGSQDGTGSQATFRRPAGIILDSHGDLLVADYDANRIRKVTQAGVVTTIAGNATAGFADGTGSQAMFSNPDCLALDSQDNLYIGDGGNNRIRKMTPAGVVTTFAGNGVAGHWDGYRTNALFNHPDAVLLDGKGNLYVGDRYGQYIRKIDANGLVTTVAGNGVATFADGTGAAASFNQPYGFAMDSQGTLYVGDLYTHRIRKIQ